MPRPEHPIITRDRAANAALDVIDTCGLDSLSLKLVAERMGVKGASLYHHFANRDEILEEVARLLLKEAPLTPADDVTDWKQALIGICTASWNSVLRHPNAAPLLLQFFPKHVFLYTYDYWVKVLAAASIPAEHALWILESSERLTFGSALFAASSRSRGLAPFPSFDGAKFPYLQTAIRANRLSEREMFLKTLRAFLDSFPDGSPTELAPATGVAAERT